MSSSPVEINAASKALFLLSSALMVMATAAQPEVEADEDEKVIKDPSFGSSMGQGAGIALPPYVMYLMSALFLAFMAWIVKTIFDADSERKTKMSEKAAKTAQKKEKSAKGSRKTD